MNGINNPIIFYPAILLLITSAILTIKFKNIFYSLLSAIVVFFITGLLFYLLGSEYNAVIQIAIYGIAVPIILGLSVMFTEDVECNKIINKNIKQNSFLIIIGILFIFTILTFLSFSSFNIMSFDGINSYNTLNAFAEGLFVNYVWAFELISIILTIIIIGITLFNNKNTNYKNEDKICKK